MSDPLWLFLGRWLERRGLSTLAEACFRSASGGSGKLAREASFRLSQRLLASDRNRDAASVCETALERDPNHARLWCALGAARRRLAQMDAAREAYERAIALDPGYAQARNNLGEWWLVKGDWTAALAHLNHALALDPGLYEALNNRVAALYELGRFEEAEAAARAAITLHPTEASLHVNLGNVLLHTGNARLAVMSFQKALECDPARPEAHLVLSALFGETHRLAEALGFLEHEIAAKGETAQRLAMVAMAQQAKGDWTGAEKTCLKVLEMQPSHVSALITLAGCHSARGDHRGAICLHEQALAANPAMAAMHSNIAFDSTYLHELTAEEVFAYHQAWTVAFGKAPPMPPVPREGESGAERPLRIGYVSGDFGTHPVGFLLRDVIRHHDKASCSIHCYSMMRGADDVTNAIRESAESWVDALLMSDDELARKIREDQIDILVDLSGHTAFNRLPVFVKRPAPVQATWIGYFHSTGLDCIDYFITDPITTPKGSPQLFSETPVCLPNTRFCYSPPDYAPAVSPPPVNLQGRITFGCFNRIEKVVDPVVEAWAKIVQAVPGSRLLLKSGKLECEGIAESHRRRFALRGLDADRLELRGPSPHVEMLGQYGEVDIALDPFPFNGGMTTLEALWMGVPVVALEGNSVVSRQSTSALANVGLHDLVFPDVASYVAGAVALAEDPARLGNLRREMRSRMSRSPVCHPVQFVRDLELLYRRMWQAWCRGEKLTTEIVSAPPAPRKTVLHVGCGGSDIRSLPALFRRGWQEIRVDIDPIAMPDVIASMTDMSAIDSGSADAVYSSHNIEHVHPHEVGVALSEFRRVLKPDGVLVLTCPDIQSVCALVAEDKLEEPAYISPAGPISPIDMLYGHRAAMAAGNLFMAHKTGFTAKSLGRALEECGFAATVVERGGHYDLWALAYPERPSEDRLAADRRACFPPRPEAADR